LLQYSKIDNSNKFIVATEPGIIHQMQKSSPEKVFIAAPPKDSTCGCSECNFMKLITMEKIYNSFKTESFEIELDNDIITKAQKPIKRMLDISEKLGL
jgi:quinolinate synthase